MTYVEEKVINAPVAQPGRAAGLCPVLALDKREVKGSNPFGSTRFINNVGV